MECGKTEADRGQIVLNLIYVLKICVVTLRTMGNY